MIDWTKPIETVPNERNPEPVPCQVGAHDQFGQGIFIRGDYFGCDGENMRDDDDESFPWFVGDDGDGYSCGIPVIVRNVEEKD